MAGIGSFLIDNFLLEAIIFGGLLAWGLDLVDYFYIVVGFFGGWALGVVFDVAV